MSLSVVLNVQTNDVASAVEASSRWPGRIAVGVPTKGFETVEEAIDVVRRMQSNGVLVSVGLGDGAADQWRRAHDVAVATKPYHLNQVYPAAGLSAGALETAGAPTIVNALVRPGERPGQVVVGTGPISSELEQPSLPVEVATALVSEIGLPSVKFYPMGGLAHLDDYVALATAAARRGLMVEATGGLTPGNLREILQAARDAGAASVMPHLYSSLKVPGGELLDLAAVAEAFAVIDEFDTEHG